VRNGGRRVTDTPTERGPENPWERLRRRKVVQWGLVYGAAAWGFLQGLEYLSGTYDWPRPIQQYTTLALLIGLPIVLVLAWYHGDRGQQRITTPEFAILTLLLLLGGGAFWYYQRASDAQIAAVAEGPTQSTPPPEAGVLRLAVLPLENLSPDPANAFFADGLHDEILSAMPATPELQVVSGTTMRSYAGTRKPVKQIAFELGASHLLAGAVRRAGEHVRLSLHLVDAATDSNVWSRTFDRQLRDALSLQSEVATEVATALNLRLLPAENRAKTDAANAPATKNPVAYDLYLKAKLQLDVAYNQLTTPSDFDRLEALVTRAIEIDPGFANAYTLRSRALLSRLWVLSDLTDEQWTMISSDIDSARRIAGDTEAVLAAQTSLEYYGHMDYGRALETTRAALSRYPNDLLLREFEGLLLRRLGQWENAIDVFQELVDREPSNPSYVGTLVELLHSMRRYAEVISAVEAFERRAPPDSYVAEVGAWAREAMGRDPEALRRYLDTWRDRLDPDYSSIIELNYLRDSGRTEDLSSMLVAARGKYITHPSRTSSSGTLMPFACLRGFGRMLQGAANAPEQAREVSAMAASISELPSRRWNVALLKAHAALFSGDRKSAVEQARHALELMSVQRDALNGPGNMAAAAIVLAWAGESDETVQLLRRVINLPNDFFGWAMVRDPLLAVPLAGNPAFEALKREVDPPN
jgi:TolB-like protein